MGFYQPLESGGELGEEDASLGELTTGEERYKSEEFGQDFLSFSKSLLALEGALGMRGCMMHEVMNHGPSLDRSALFGLFPSAVKGIGPSG